MLGLKIQPEIISTCTHNKLTFIIPVILVKYRYIMVRLSVSLSKKDPVLKQEEPFCIAK